MAENEENVNEEQTPEATTDEAAPEEAPVEEAPVDEAPAEEAPVEEAPAEEPKAEAAPAEPEEQLSPKERRRRSRSLHTGEAQPARTIEERAAARAEARRVKARHRTAYRARLRQRRADAPQAAAPVVEEEAKTGARAKVRQGVVVSDKADKTITVRVDMARQHRRYGKIVRTSSTLHAHDESNDAHVGDTVRLIESRPLSRLKRWRLVEVVERAR
jgi:small subunit ribosomal protein S17